MVVDLTVNG
ncbi:hypothetical protein D039_4209A, partial [Vibrio parahaemolyticus EKP-028]